MHDGPVQMDTLGGGEGVRQMGVMNAIASVNDECVKAEEVAGDFYGGGSG